VKGKGLRTTNHRGECSIVSGPRIGVDQIGKQSTEGGGGLEQKGRQEAVLSEKRDVTSSKGEGGEITRGKAGESVAAVLGKDALGKRPAPCTGGKTSVYKRGILTSIRGKGETFCSPGEYVVLESGDQEKEKERRLRTFLLACQGCEIF